MAVRLRANGKTIVCAAKSEVEDGDCYIDDNWHYELAVELKVLRVIGEDEFDADLWAFVNARDKEGKSP
ncbi:MAG TPA: hypothetical protein VMW24_25035 [Sedimentisphaerales bacterium]|nr:hypothetical protein [Sedimentisphaerales bacterium]